MTLSHQHFAIPDQFKLAQLLEMLQRYAKVRVESCRTTKRTIFDTFNWLLYQKGAYLEMQQIDTQKTIVWHAANNVVGENIPGLSKVPVFAHDLPPSALRNNLAALIDVRALQPQISISSHATSICVINDEGKALVRIKLDEMTCKKHTARREIKLCKYLTLQRIKGYNEDFDKLAAFIAAQSFMPAYANLPKLALLTLGITPHDYNSNFKVKLDPNLSAIDAARKILSGLLDVIKLNKLGTIEGIDTEYLHDLRIAVRKSRSLLTRLKLVFPASRISRYINEFAWLGQATAPVRDLDVYLLNFDTYSNSIPEKHRQALQPLHAYLRQQRDIEQKKLVDTLQSKRFNKLITDWRAFLLRPISTTESAPNAHRDILSLADEFIWKLYRKVLKEGKAIKPESPDEDLHELRKTCKKLRYLMAFFKSLYSEREISHAIKILKQFQSLLGDFQDYSVQTLMLEQFLDHMRAANVLEKGTSNAIQALVITLQKKQKTTRKHFSDAFEVFSSNANQAEFRLLFIDTRNKNDIDKTVDYMGGNI